MLPIRSLLLSYQRIIVCLKSNTLCKLFWYLSFRQKQYFWFQKVLRIGYSSSRVSCSCDIHVTDAEISYLDIQGAHDQQIRTSSQWQGGSFEAKNVSKVKLHGFEKKSVTPCQWRRCSSNLDCRCAFRVCDTRDKLPGSNGLIILKSCGFKETANLQFNKDSVL